MSQAITQRRAATLHFTRERIRAVQHLDWSAVPMQPRKPGWIRLLNFFEFVADLTTDDELRAWFTKIDEQDHEQALQWAGRTTTRGSWPPKRTTLMRALRLYVLSLIVGRPLSSGRHMTSGEVAGIARAFMPVAESAGELAPSMNIEAYLLVRALIKQNGLLLAHLQTVPALYSDD